MLGAALELCGRSRCVIDAVSDVPVGVRFWPWQDWMFLCLCYEFLHPLKPARTAAGWRDFSVVEVFLGTLSLGTCLWGRV